MIIIFFPKGSSGASTPNSPNAVNVVDGNGDASMRIALAHGSGIGPMLPSAADNGTLLGVVHVGLAGRVMGEVAPTESLQFSLRLRAVALGLQRIANVTVFDQLASERHVFAELGYVVVLPEGAELVELDQPKSSSAHKHRRKKKVAK